MLSSVLANRFLLVIAAASATAVAALAFNLDRILSSHSFRDLYFTEHFFSRRLSGCFTSLLLLLLIWNNARQLSGAKIYSGADL